MHFRCWFRCTLQTFLVAGWASAGSVEIAWQSAMGAINRQSDGTPLTGSFIFEIGGFTGAFLPTSENRNEWRDHWVSHGKTSYLEVGQRFSFAKNLDNNDDPFSLPVAPPATSKLAYIWGYSLTEPTAEWILVSKNDWFWPDTSQPFIPTDAYVISANQTGYQVILGAVNANGVLMRTESVADPAPPYLTYEAWVLDHFLPAERNDVSISGHDANPDGDEKTNFYEYAIGTDPRKVSVDTSLSLKTVGAPSSTYVELMIRKSSQARVVIGLIGSDDLLNFLPVTPAPTLLVNTPSALTYKDFMSGQSRRFYRLKISAF